jgi:hypothetical protein
LGAQIIWTNAAPAGRRDVTAAARVRGTLSVTGVVSWPQAADPILPAEVSTARARAVVVRRGPAVAWAWSFSSPPVAFGGSLDTAVRSEPAVRDPATDPVRDLLLRWACSGPAACGRRAACVRDMHMTVTYRSPLFTPRQSAVSTGARIQATIRITRHALARTPSSWVASVRRDQPGTNGEVHPLWRGGAAKASILLCASSDSAGQPCQRPAEKTGRTFGNACMHGDGGRQPAMHAWSQRGAEPSEPGHAPSGGQRGTSAEGNKSAAHTPPSHWRGLSRYSDCARAAGALAGSLPAARCSAGLRQRRAGTDSAMRAACMHGKASSAQLPGMAPEQSRGLGGGPGRPDERTNGGRLKPGETTGFRNRGIQLPVSWC